MSASKANASPRGNSTATSSRNTSKRKALQLEEDTSDEDGRDAVRMDRVDNIATAVTSKVAMDNSVIDQPLLNVVDLVHGIGMVSSMPGIEGLVDPLQYDDQATLHTETDLLTSLSPNDFIDKLSKLNIVHSTQPAAKHVERGGSREEPHRFKKPCLNAAHGCTKLFETDEQVRVHMLYCKSTSVADHEAAEKYVATKLTKSFICKVCGAGCSSKGALQVHERSHDTSWVPK
jgi:hypothetical protein